MTQDNTGKWNLADVGRFFRNSFSAILKGEFLLRLNVGRYFVHILYAFLLLAVIICVSLMTESTMAKVEQNKQTLKELEIINSARTYELVSLSRRSSVQELLGSMGSKVQEPQKPATVLKK